MIIALSLNAFLFLPSALQLLPWQGYVPKLAAGLHRCGVAWGTAEIASFKHLLQRPVGDGRRALDLARSAWM
jgi:hypothetical protein